MFARDAVPGDDASELRRRRPQVVADDLAEHRAVIMGALQVAAAGAEHRSGLAGNPGDGIRRAAAEDTGGVALVVSFDAATGEEHDAPFGMIGAVGRVL